jgi:argininosuccinate synthase
MQRLIASLPELLAAPPRHMVLLYSGGVDGSYLLQRLSERSIVVTALNVLIGASAGASDPGETAEMLGARYREVDATGDFFAEFVPAAIHADAYYQGLFPVGSTLTRPLMARTACAVAAELGCDAVGHTATYMQNSAARLGRSVAALNPGLDLVAPFLGTYLPRTEKVASLGRAGIGFPAGVHSVDVNPWSRVIENGSLENPENPLDESVFTLTRHIGDCDPTPSEITLTFKGGLPVALDDRPCNLDALVSVLNTLAGSHGVGRFSGLEDTPFGVKNHEVRESPAAAVITTAHRALANAVYQPREHTVRAFLATEWTTTAVHGGWFSHLGGTLARCLADLDRPVTGTVQLRLHAGTVTVVRLHSPHGLYYARLGEEFHDWMGAYAYQPWHQLLTLPDQVRGVAAAELSRSRSDELCRTRPPRPERPIRTSSDCHTWYGTAWSPIRACPGRRSATTCPAPPPASATRRAPNSRSAASPWSRTPGPTWIHRSTGSPTEQT